MRLQIFLLVILFAMFCEYHCQTTTSSASSSVGWNYEENYKFKDKSNGDDDDDDNKKKKDDDDDYNSEENDDNDPAEKSDSAESRTTRRRKSPDEYGNINLYFRSSSKGSKRKKNKKIRFPVHRFERRRAPSFSPLISFLPWLPIFSDRLTKQTIIYSPVGGVYIIPPVINFYGQLFSIAELIASGYCSLVSSGDLPPPAVDVAPLVQPGAVAGPAIPPANPVTGGFRGAVRTELRSFARPRYPESIREEQTVVDARSSRGGYGY